MTSKSDPRGHPGLKLCIHVSVMGYYRFTNFRRSRRGSGHRSGSKWYFFGWFHMEYTKMYLLEHKHKQVRQDKSQVNYIVTFRDRILKTFHCRFRSSHSCSWDICMFSSKSHVLVNLTIDVIWPWSLNPRLWRCYKMEFYTSPLLPTFHNTIVYKLLWARFLQIRLGNESCDQISASSNGDKSRESCHKNAPPPRKTSWSLFTRVYTLIEFSQTKRCFFSFV